MVFSGIPFLFYYLPAVLLIYFAVPGKYRNAVLLLASLLFYAWGEPRYVILMMISILIGYFTAFPMAKYAGTWRSKLALAAAVFCEVGMLAVFKYADFFLGSFNSAFGLSLPLLRLTLPIGISFYTFQILSYTLDVYKAQVAPQRNLVHLAAYVTMFPQLIAGPIVRYSDVERELESRTHSVENAALGIRRLILGLGKKVLLANTLGELCSFYKATAEPSILFTALYALAYTLHIYFDFSGYSDMAIGLGRIMGFHFPENFNFPYISRSCTEFWRRWHMTLGSWFRDYIYIPMGGNRVPRARFFLNILTVWMLTGLWHGAAWNFVLWGLFFAVILLVEKLFLMPYLNRGRIWPHIYTMALIIISFILFDSAHLGAAVRTVGDLFGITGLPLTSPESLYYAKSYLPLLAVGILGATPLPRYLAGKLAQHPLGQKVLPVAEPLVLAVLLLICTAFLVDGSYNPFLYFRF